ncbi:MAG: heavy-metal-associated domain-containing protein [Hydrogenophilaceae bacterium]|nr:heavy-metal-associated domain-containing protein [Hydrogenophilaceae bacterium]
MQSTVLIITGMTCGGCVNSVTRVLKALPGVSQVEVTLLPSQARVNFDESQVNPDSLRLAVQEAGFTVTGFK